MLAEVQRKIISGFLTNFQGCMTKNVLFKNLKWFLLLKFYALD